MKLQIKLELSSGIGQQLLQPQIKPLAQFHLFCNAVSSLLNIKSAFPIPYSNLLFWSENQSV